MLLSSFTIAAVFPVLHQLFTQHSVYPVRVAMRFSISVRDYKLRDNVDRVWSWFVVRLRRPSRATTGTNARKLEYFMHSVTRISTASRWWVGVTTFGLLMFAAAATFGCKQQATKKTESESRPAPSSQESAKPLLSSAPITVERAQQMLNPENLPPYTGPTGTIEGTVRITGDPSPETNLRLHGDCMGAAATYRHVFREGEGRVVADVLVAVTGYKGYVPAKEEAVRINIENCAFSTKTVAMTFGQRLEVQNIDKTNSFVPVLHGAKASAWMVAVPRADPVKLYPDAVGRFLLADNMQRSWMEAEVLVLKYPTHQVTGLSGRYRIEGIPVGELSVDAWLPSVDIQQNKKVTLSEGQTLTVDLELAFDRAKYDESRKQPEPASSAPVKPVIK